MSFENPIVGGEGGELIRESIKSPNFVTDVSGWIIRRDGSAEFYDVRIRADLEVGDTITIGPNTNPQVVLGSTVNHAFIQFPTNAAFETTPGQIYADTGTVDDTVSLELYSGTAGGSFTNQASIVLESGDGAAVDESIQLSVDSADIEMSTGLIYLNANDVDVRNEIRVSTDNPDVNFPIRVVGGKTVTSATTTLTTLGTTDTEVTDAEATDVYLESGVAYEISVKVYVQKTTGVAAAGTHSIDWKVWDGAVGSGAQLGSLIRKAVTTATNNLRDSQSFVFCFEYTGTSGTKTLRLSGDRSTGADTLQAVVNDNYLMLVKRIGDPAKITNL